MAERDGLQPRQPVAGLATAAADLGVTAAGSRSAGAIQDEKGQKWVLTFTSKGVYSYLAALRFGVKTTFTTGC